MREEAFCESAHTEFFQVSARLGITWSRREQDFLRFEFAGQPLVDDAVLTVALHEYHVRNAETSLGMPLSVFTQGRKTPILATTGRDAYLEYFAENPFIRVPALGRLRVVD